MQALRRRIGRLRGPILRDVASMLREKAGPAPRLMIDRQLRSLP
jgi:hypothetical protein